MPKLEDIELNITEYEDLETISISNQQLEQVWGGTGASHESLHALHNLSDPPVSPNPTPIPPDPTPGPYPWAS